MKEQILQFVKETASVSFVELQRHLGDAARGDLAWSPATRPNFVFWAGMSEEFIDAIVGLLREGQLIAKPTTLLVYVIDGSYLDLPVAKGNYRYKKPHWVPLVFDAAEVMAEDVRRGIRKAARRHV